MSASDNRSAEQRCTCAIVTDNHDVACPLYRPLASKDVNPWELIHDKTISQLVFTYEMVLTEMRRWAAGSPQIKQWVERLDFERDEFVKSMLVKPDETPDELTVKFPRAWAPYLQAVILGSLGDFDGDGDCRWHLNELQKFLGKASERTCTCGPSDVHMECPVHGATARSALKTGAEP